MTFFYNWRAGMLNLIFFMVTKQMKRLKIIFYIPALHCETVIWNICSTKKAFSWTDKYPWHFPTLLAGPDNKDMGGSQRDNDSSPNLSFNDLKQKEIEIKEGSARVLWYETQLLIGQPKWGLYKIPREVQNYFFHKLIR